MLVNLRVMLKERKPHVYFIGWRISLEFDGKQPVRTRVWFSQILSALIETKTASIQTQIGSIQRLHIVVPTGSFLTYFLRVPTMTPYAISAGNSPEDSTLVYTRIIKSLSLYLYRQMLSISLYIYMSILLLLCLFYYYYPMSILCLSAQRAEQLRNRAFLAPYYIDIDVTYLVLTTFSMPFVHIAQKHLIQTPRAYRYFAQKLSRLETTILAY